MAGDKNSTSSSSSSSSSSDPAAQEALEKAMKDRNVEGIKPFINQEGVDFSKAFIVVNEIFSTYNLLLLFIKLVELGLDVNLKLRNQETALILAIRFETSDTVAELIKLGADLNIRSIYKETPLILAVGLKNADIVTQLIQAGADLNLKNADNKTALDIARDKKNDAIIKLLEKGKVVNDSIPSTEREVIPESKRSPRTSTLETVEIPVENPPSTPINQGSISQNRFCLFATTALTAGGTLGVAAVTAAALFAVAAPAALTIGVFLGLALLGFAAALLTSAVIAGYNRSQTPAPSPS